MSDRRRILVVGGAAWNHIIHLDTDLPPPSATQFARRSYEVPGGTGLGKATCLSLFDLEVRFQLALGDDDYAERILSYLQAFPIELILNRSGAATERHTNLMLPGDKRLSVYTAPPPDCTAAELHATEAAMPGADIIMLSILPYVRQILPAAQRSGAPLWIDLHNYDGTDPYHAPFIAAANVLFLSGERLEDPKGYMERQIDGGKSLIIVTQGKRGAMCLTAARTWHYQEAIPVEPITDTNGAGDSFAAGFAHAYLKHAPIDDCLRAGALASAATLQSRYPTNADFSAKHLADAMRSHIYA